MTKILEAYKFIRSEQPYLVLNPDLRSLYQNLPWDYINHPQKRISKIAKQKLNMSGVKDLGEKRLNEKARPVL